MVINRRARCPERAVEGDPEISTTPGGRPKSGRARRPRIGAEIKAPRVLVIAPDGEKIGELATAEAIYLADELGLDLVEVAPDARPPVCRILDYGKLRYEESRKEREARKKRPKDEKIVQLRPQIDVADYQTKVRAISKFLGAGHPVVVQMRLRGRELSQPNIGSDLFERVLADTEERGKVSSGPRREGRVITLRLEPLRNSGEKKQGSQSDQSGQAA